MTPVSGADGTPALRVIYLALAAGVLLFALVAAFLGPVSGTAEVDLFRWIWLAVALFSTLGAGVVRGRAPDPRRDPDGARKAAILVWALAEAQALVGLALYLLGGSSVIAILSVGLFLYLLARYRPAEFEERP